MIAPMVSFFHLRRWRWLIAFGALIGLGLAYGLVRAQPMLYTATSTIAIRLSAGDIPRAMTTYVQLTRSPVVLNNAIRAAGLDIGLSDLSGNLTVLSDANGLLTLTVTAADPDRAQGLVKALTAQLVASNKLLTANPDVNQLQTQLAHVQPELDTARAAWQGIDTQIGKTSDPAAVTDLRAQRQDAIDHYLLLEADFTALGEQISRLTSNVPVLIPLTPLAPAVPAEAIQPLVVLAIGSLIGSVVGGAIGLGIENADTVLRNPTAVQRALDLPTLGTLPLITAKPGEEKLIVRADMPQAESYRALAVRLGLSDAPSGWAIGITSPGTNEGKSLTAANLAIALAQAGHRTLIVDADLRTPAQHRLFRLSNRDGLTGLLHEFTLRADLQGDADTLADLLSVSPGLKVTDVPNLSILTSGPLPAHPESILTSDYLTRLLRALTDQYDRLVLDLPSAVTPGTAARLAVGLDLTVLVVDAQRTRRRVARRALAALQQEPGLRLGGVALNRARAAR